jgi:hypothetical protein
MRAARRLSVSLMARKEGGEAEEEEEEEGDAFSTQRAMVLTPALPSKKNFMKKRMMVGGAGWDMARVVRVGERDGRTAGVIREMMDSFLLEEGGVWGEDGTEGEVSLASVGSIVAEGVFERPATSPFGKPPRPSRGTPSSVPSSSPPSFRTSPSTPVRMAEGGVVRHGKEEGEEGGEGKAHDAHLRALATLTPSGPRAGRDERRKRKKIGTPLAEAIRARGREEEELGEGEEGREEDACLPRRGITITPARPPSRPRPPTLPTPLRRDILSRCLATPVSRLSGSSPAVKEGATDSVTPATVAIPIGRAARGSAIPPSLPSSLPSSLPFSPSARPRTPTSTARKTKAAAAVPLPASDFKEGEGREGGLDALVRLVDGRRSLLPSLLPPLPPSSPPSLLPSPLPSPATPPLCPSPVSLPFLMPPLASPSSSAPAPPSLPLGGPG